jgi:Cu-processing system permease protein
MKNTIKILRYQLQDVLRGRWLLGYGAFFLLVTDAFFRFGGDGPRVILSLMNVVLLVIPLMAAVLGAMYLYNSREYIELLLSQPIERGSLFAGIFGGLSLPLAGAFAVGVTLPFLYHGALADGITPLLVLLGTGVLLTVIFVALAFAVALATEDRIRGLGLALGAWLFFAVIYNGIMLLVIQLFHAWPMQQPVIAMSLLNPIDLGRILLLLNLDAAALMGFTGAVFQKFFGSATGQAASVAALLTWLAVPLLIGRAAFLRKNF